MKKYPLRTRTETHKKCNKCLTEKELSEFYKSIENKKNGDSYIRYTSKCVECLKSIHEDRVQNNPDFVEGRANYKKVWYLDNKERLNKKGIEYSKVPENKKRRKEYLIEYRPRRSELRKERANNDPLYKLEEALRGRLYAFFKSKKHHKNSSSKELLGCDMLTAKKHIERQFLNGMDWSNHGFGDGKWHIDHIIPLASAKTEQDLRQLFHYTNIQPLWHLDNIRKSSKIPQVQMKIAI